MEFNNTASLASLGGTAGPWGAVAGAGVGAVMDIFAAKSAKKQAQNRANALAKKAAARLEQGKQQAGLELAKGAANKTSEFSSLLSRGVGRDASTVGASLDEIANRAQFSADQAMASAKEDSDTILSDRGDLLSNAKDAQRASNISTFGTLLGQGANFFKK